MTRPRLLDLFCGQGGAGVGYYRAGFDVVGVDIVAQPRYPFTFVLGDALEYVSAHGHEFDVIHASPPCQGYSVTLPLSNGQHPKLIPETRTALIATAKPYVIENVEGAKSEMVNPFMLCGTMFGLKVLRHRLFETNIGIWWAPFTCKHDGMATGNRHRRYGFTNTPSMTRDGFAFVTVAGNNYLYAEGADAMGIDWTTKKGLTQAIPPAYTYYIGCHLMAHLERAAACAGRAQ